MTPSELKYLVKQANTESHFFDRETMRYFGDTMKNYGVRTIKIMVEYNADGNYIGEPQEIEVYELYRKRAVKEGLKDSTYFRKDNLTRTFPV